MSGEKNLFVRCDLATYRLRAPVVPAGIVEMGSAWGTGAGCCLVGCPEKKIEGVPGPEFSRDMGFLFRLRYRSSRPGGSMGCAGYIRHSDTGAEEFAPYRRDKNGSTGI